MWVGMLQYCLASCLMLLSTLAFVQLFFLVLMEWFGWCEVWFLHLLWLASGTWMHLQTAWSPCPQHVQGRRVWACCSCYTWLITTSQISASLSWWDTQTCGSCIWQTTTCRLSLQGRSIRLLGRQCSLGGSCHLPMIVHASKSERDALPVAWWQKPDISTHKVRRSVLRGTSTGLL